MRKKLSFLLALLLILPTLTACGPVTDDKDTQDSAYTAAENETVLYVAVDGDDTAEGTKDAPLATLDGAREKVRSLLPGTDNKITVVFEAGDYFMDKGVVFDEGDSGREDAPVTYRAENGAKVRFIGGRNVPAGLITKAESGSVYDRVTDDGARAALLQADVSTLVDTYNPLYGHYHQYEWGDGSYNPVEIYLGETAITPARWPNYEGRDRENYVEIGREEGKERIFNSEDRSVKIFYGDDVAQRVATWSDESLSHLYLYGYQEFTWVTNWHEVIEVNRDEQYVYLPRGTNDFSRYTEGGRSVFYNIPEEIDVPGESYVDRDAKIAYFYPTEDYDENKVIVSTLTDDMMTFTNTAHIAFEGLEFGFTRGSVIQSTGLNDFTMKNCRLAHTSSKIGYFYDSKDVRFDSCELCDSAHGALVISGGDRNTLESSGCIIENCDIHHFNRDGTEESPELTDSHYYSAGTVYTAGLILYADGAIVRHNKIHDCIHTALFPQSNDLLIEYNEFYNCMTEASDMGVIYYWCNPTLLGMVIRYNYFHDCGGVTGDAGQFCIYADCGSMSPDTYGNLFVNACGFPIESDLEARPKAPMLLSQFGHIHNNVFVNAQAGFRYGDWSLPGTGRRQTDWIAFLHNKGTYGGMHVADRFAEVDYDSEAWHSAYDGTIWGNLFDYFSPELLAELEPIDDMQTIKRKVVGIAPMNTNEIDNNVFIDVIKLVNGGNENSLNAHDNMTDGDYSMFVDAAGGDYRFTDEALQAIREVCPDFEELPLDEIGIRS